MDACFGLRLFANEMESRGELTLAGLAYGGDVLLRANAPRIDHPAIAEAISALEQFASQRGRRLDRDVAAAELGAAPVVGADVEVLDDDTQPDLRVLGVLPIEV